MAFPPAVRRAAVGFSSLCGDFFKSTSVAFRHSGCGNVDVYGRWENPLDQEQKVNYVLCSFREETMFRAVVEEAAALTSIALFVGMVAVWVQVIAAL